MASRPRTRFADNDNHPEYLELNSDGDGVPDSTEGTADSDDDGIPDFRDADA